MDRHFTICSNLEAHQFFFCRYHSDYNLGDAWVPISFTLPTWIVPRPGFEDGCVETVEEWIHIFKFDNVQIPHPRPDLDEGVFDPVGFYSRLREDRRNRDERTTLQF